MAYGFIEVIPASSHTELSLSGTGGGTQYPSIKILNPNDGVVYVAQNRDIASIGQGAWEWKVPSQSYAALPGPFTSVGLFYLDQSGAGRQGEITIYASNNKLDDPLFVAIGRALQAATGEMDITEGGEPATPGAGILRLWAASADESLHRLQNNNVDARLLDTAASGVVTSNMLAPGAVVSKILSVAETTDFMNNTALAANSVVALSNRYVATKQDASSYLLAVVRASSTYTGLQNSQMVSVLFVNDGAIKDKLAACVLVGVAAGASNPASLIGGTALIPTIAPGSVAFQFFVQAPPSSGANAYARYATQPSIEFCSIDIWEMKAPS